MTISPEEKAELDHMAALDLMIGVLKARAMASMDGR
jgi:hypothetical protein